MRGSFARSPNLLLLIALACSTADPTKPVVATPDAAVPIVSILADVNRNGVLDWNDPDETGNKTMWTATHGAVFLANIDDDTSQCPTVDASGNALSDIDLPKCNDAADTVLNGPNDALDLAPLGVQAWPGASDSTVATLSVDATSAPFVHLFIQRQGALTYFDWKNDQLQIDEIRNGATLAIEATDIVRDSAVWSGLTTVSLSAAGLTDSVVLRVAPVVTEHHLLQENRVFITSFQNATGSADTRTSLRTAIDVNASDAGVEGGVDGGDTYDRFVYELNGDQMFRGQAVFNDQWTQDFFEVGYMAMPVVGGTHVIDVYYRSANVVAPTNAKNPLRVAGKAVFMKFRGPDAAGVQAFDIKHSQSMDSLNSFGDLETIPPYQLGTASYPLGRLFRGSVPLLHPDPVFERMLEAQAVQPPVYIDTSWLLVGHVDETVSFVRANTPRGWALLINDPRMAKQMLVDQVTAGNGSVKMFVGKNWVDNNGVETPADISIQEVLADTNVMSESSTTAAHVDSQLAALKAATGLTDSEIIHVPYLHEPVSGLSLAYQPGTVNGLYFKADTFAAPDPHGPVINGQDIFKVQMETALSAVGVKVAWIEDWDLYHRLEGEIHCGTNSRRSVGDAKWWLSGY